MRGETVVKPKSQCSVLGCEQLAFASLAMYSLCRKHFFSGCRAGFEMCDDLLQNRSARKVQLVWQFLAECEAGVLELSQKASGLRYCEQTELVELLVRLEVTKRHLRRSARRAASVPVLLCSDSPGNLWEERTKTLQLSRYGTKLACQHTVKTEEILSLVRLDIGRETEVRVVWTKLKGEQHEIGVEHLGRANFWGWDWTTDDTHCDNSPIYLDNTRGEGKLEFIVPTVEVGDNPERGSHQSVSSSLHRCSTSRKIRRQGKRQL